MIERLVVAIGGNAGEQEEIAARAADALADKAGTHVVAG